MINLLNPNNEKAKIILHLRIGVNKLDEFLKELCSEIKKNSNKSNK